MSAFVVAIGLLLCLVFWRQVLILLGIGVFLLIFIGLVLVVETIQSAS